VAAASTTAPTRPLIRLTWDRRAALTALALLAWAALLLVARLWGLDILESGRVIRLASPPIVGWDEWTLDARVVFPLVVGGAGVVAAPRLARTLPWGWLLLGFAALAALWAVALALTMGTSGLLRPLVLRGDEYLLDVPNVGSPGRFLDQFVENIDRYVVHVRSHPPGFLLILWTLDWLGLGGRGWAAALCIGGGASSVPAVLIATRQLAGEGAARRAAPFLALAPAAIWVATTADAFFAGVGAWSACAVILALHRTGRRSDVLALLGGLGFGVLLMLAYALVLVGAIPFVVAVRQRRIRPIVIAAAGAAAVLGVVALFGFWWPDGLEATGEQYRLSVAKDRPLRYFAISNLAAFGIVLGPALAVALVRLRDLRLWLVVGGALLAVTIADVSNYSKGEVERIWLPFTVWVLAAGAVLWGTADGEKVARRWLALQVGFAILFEVAIKTRW
jgi:methylthioxylose transferase